VDVWLEYVQFAIGGIGQKDGIAKAREIFDRALTAVGLHYEKGSMIWDAYREFESAIYAGLQVIQLVVDSFNKMYFINDSNSCEVCKLTILNSQMTVNNVVRCSGAAWCSCQ
jgi:hypothetical protein